jgi:hypothetical protein
MSRITTAKRTDFGDPANFGVLGLQYNAPRQIQLGIRIDF